VVIKHRSPKVWPLAKTPRPVCAPAKSPRPRRKPSRAAVFSPSGSQLSDSQKRSPLVRRYGIAIGRKILAATETARKSAPKAAVLVRRIRVAVAPLLLSLCVLLASGGGSQAADLQALVKALDADNYADKSAAVEALAASGEVRAYEIIVALAEGRIYRRKADGAILAAPAGARGDPLEMMEAAGGVSAGQVALADVEPVGINNRVRRSIESALGALSFMSKSPLERRKAAESVFKSRDAGKLDAIEKALAAETDAAARKAFAEARAALIIASDAPALQKAAAVQVLTERGDQDALGLINTLAGSDDAAGVAARSAVARIQHQLALWAGLQNIFYGVSLGSVLLLAAIGLAITFGVMGIINMAHGEMVMLGAYTTFAVQELIRTRAPALFDASLFIALPLAFLVSGAVGVAIERGIIRFLYGRPLETLLATWGLSLILQQSVRSLFGPSNREVGNPSFMSGAFELGGLAITWNRLWIVLFSLIVFATLQLVLKRTPFGLQTRAVTQNRRMAAAMGIRTSWIDPLTFGLGSGIAGIAGVALSQIDNVSPNLGQTYIIDSFMVVVFGGVGNLWGTLLGALSLGVVNKFLEPYAGAVLGKILVLVLLILFIQKRPRGLFALKGRALEA